MNEEELQELEALRAEKRQRQQTERARAALETAGVPGTFSPLLIGSDDADTDDRVARFCASYQAALSEDVRRRLPQQAPITAAPAAQKPRRGIQRLR